MFAAGHDGNVLQTRAAKTVYVNTLMAVVAVVNCSTISHSTQLILIQDCCWPFLVQRVFCSCSQNINELSKIIGMPQVGLVAVQWI